MQAQRITFVVFLVAIVGLLKYCDVSWSSPSQNERLTYFCIGPCVPVHFEVKVPTKETLHDDVFLSGNFNGWIHADQGLKLEKIDAATYSATVYLPKGDSIHYRYSVSRDQKYGFAEYGELRSLKVMDGNLRRDSVFAWGQGILRSAVWTPEKLEAQNIQGLFLDQSLSGIELPLPITAESVDTLLGNAETLWKENGIIYYPGYDRLVTRAYGEAFSMQMIRRGYAVDFSTECHMKVAYALPAFLREVAYIEAEPVAARFDLLGGHPVVIDAIYCDNISDAQLAAMQELFYKRIPDLLFHPAADSDELVIDADRASLYMSLYEPDYSFLRQIVTGSLSEAENQFKSLILDPPNSYAGNDQHELRRRFMTKRLVSAYMAEGATEKALGILDFVAENTSGLEVRSDSLEAWYRSVAEEEGGVRFKQILSIVNREEIRGKGEPLLLSGSYLNLTDSTRFDLASLNGKTVVFDFWATSCSPCLQEIPELKAFYSQIQHRDDLVFLSISEDRISTIQSPLEQLENVIEAQGIKYPILYDDPDNPISALFPITGYPSKFVVDKEGRLVASVGSIWSTLQ